MFSNQNKITPKFINSLSYTDFIGLINQWNVPPGAFSTINKWAKFGNVSKESNVLEIGCTTGFSIRELSFLTSCEGLGIDTSNSSIKKAIFNKTNYTPDLKISYEIADAYKFKPTSKFSHLIFGAGLKFFKDPKQMLDTSVQWLKNPGYILSCEFYIFSPVPKSSVKKAKAIFGIEITQTDYKDVMKKYSNLELIYEDRNMIYKETKKELDFYCKSTIKRSCDFLKIEDKNVYKTMYKRLFEIKNMSNVLRKYQNYCVLVHRYRKKLYKQRYVELF